MTQSPSLSLIPRSLTLIVTDLAVRVLAYGVKDSQFKDVSASRTTKKKRSLLKFQDYDNLILGRACDNASASCRTRALIFLIFKVKKVIFPF